MNSPRPKPYIWTSWLTSLLSGADKCQWKSWMKAHYRYAKIPGDGGFDLEAWTKQHDEMTTIRVVKLHAQGLKVTVEDENSFKIDGRNAVLSGKPDIVAMNVAERSALVVDEKSGRQKDSDRWQVLVYMWAMGLTRLQGWTIDGEVEYRGSQLQVKASELGVRERSHIIGVINIVGGSTEPERTPSAVECKYCDILDCPDRFPTETSTVTTTEF